MADSLPVDSGSVDDILHQHNLASAQSREAGEAASCTSALQGLLGCAWNMGQVSGNGKTLWVYSQRQSPTRREIPATECLRAVSQIRIWCCSAVFTNNRIQTPCGALPGTQVLISADPCDMSLLHPAQVGQQGTWLMMEEALSELARYQRTCELAGGRGALRHLSLIHGIGVVRYSGDG
jgi:hypothetical protein